MTGQCDPNGREVLHPQSLAYQEGWGRDEIRGERAVPSRQGSTARSAHHVR